MEFGERGLALGELLLVVGLDLRIAGGREQRQVFGLGFLARREDAVERVVVRLRDGVELVVVAPRAGDGEAHEAAADDVDAVVDDVGLVVEEAASEGEKAERGVWDGVFRRGDLVPGDLLDDELVVRQVGIQRGDDPVAVGVAVGEIARLVAGEVALGVGVARHVEPVAAPAFAVAGRGEQAVHDFGKGVGRGVLFKRLDLRGGRRQAGEVVGRAADERALRGGRGGLDAFGRELGADGGVDGAGDAGDHGRDFERLPRPVSSGRSLLHAELFRCATFRPRHAHADPCREVGDLRVGQLVGFLRHLGVALVADAFDEGTLLGLALDDDGAVLRALQDRRPRIHAERGFLLLRTVAFVALLGEDGPDLFLKELGLLGSDGAQGGEREKREGEKGGKQAHRSGATLTGERRISLAESGR